jgi:hypothetical protein
MKEFQTKEELFKYLKENKSLLMIEKKSVIKHADTISFCNVEFIDKEIAVKSSGNSNELNENELQVKVVINTTNLMDSHRDVHIKGIWNKTLKDKTQTLMLKEHMLRFENIITDKAIPSVKTMSWKNLGYNFEGSTQALIFDATISKDRNEYMFHQYRKGYVNNHSVGMNYVTLFLCINSTDKYYCEEKNNWDKYITEVSNKEVAEEIGYFWAVTEAKLIEGSAVPIGSNYATPTLSVKEYEPSNDTQKHSNSHEDTITIEQAKNTIKELFKN